MILSPICDRDDLPCGANNIFQVFGGIELENPHRFEYLLVFGSVIQNEIDVRILDLKELTFFLIYSAPEPFALKRLLNHRPDFVV